MKHHHTEKLSATAWLIIAILVFAPLIWGGNRPLPQTILGLAGTVLLLVVFWRGIPNRALAVTAAILLLSVAAYLIPLPFDVWSTLPGRDLYAEVLTNSLGPDAPTSYSISLVRHETVSALFFLIPVAAVFLGAATLTAHERYRVLVALCIVAGFQAALGLLQFGAGPGSLFYLGNEHGHGSATGTFINRNHLAMFLNLALPLSLALMANAVLAEDQPGVRRRRARSVRVLASPKVLVFAALSVLILLGVVFTRSRGGIGAGMVSVLITLIALGYLVSKSSLAKRTVVAAVFVGIGLAVVIGLAPILDRFSVGSTLDDARWSIWSASMLGATDFFPLGPGPGTFEPVYQAFHPLEFGAYIDYAHNEYVHWLFESPLLIGLWLVLIAVIAMRKTQREPLLAENKALLYGSLGALVSLSLHSTVEFGVHMPAVAAVTVLLTGMFLSSSLGRKTTTKPSDV